MKQQEVLLNLKIPLQWDASLLSGYPHHLFASTHLYMPGSREAVSSKGSFLRKQYMYIATYTERDQPQNTCKDLPVLQSEVRCTGHYNTTISWQVVPNVVHK